ncbi:MAG: transglutaminase-like domain-containing protein [bacterium]
MKTLHISILILLFIILLSTDIPATAYSSPGYNAGTMDKKKKDKNEKEDDNDDGTKHEKNDNKENNSHYKCGPYCSHSDKKPPKLYGPSQRNLEVEYKFHISNLPANMRTAYAWVPMPRTTSYQTLIDYKVSGNWKYKIVSDRIYGNQYLMIDLISNENRKSPNAQIKVKYNVHRESWQPISACIDNSSNRHFDERRYLEPDRYVPIDGDLRNEAKIIIGSESGFHVQARLLFDNIVANIRYDESGLSTSKGDAWQTWQNRSGSSTDIHSMFIGETRSVDIPSRLVAGITVPIGSKGEISLYHTWAEFYDPGLGWLPVDIADAINKPDYRDSYFGGLDANRIEFTIGRDIPIPGAGSKPVNISFYPHVEVNGRVHNDVKTSISYKEKPGHGNKNKHHD